VKEVLFNIFDPCTANTYILHSKETGENIPLEPFHDMTAERFISHARQDIQEGARSNSVGRLNDIIFRTII
jgi:hypothetical protein